MNKIKWSNGFAHFLSNTADKRQKQSNFDNSFYTSGYLRFRNKLQIPTTQIITYFPLDARFFTLLHSLSRWFINFLNVFLNAAGIYLLSVWYVTLYSIVFMVNAIPFLPNSNHLNFRLEEDRILIEFGTKLM